MSVVIATRVSEAGNYHSVQKHTAELQSALNKVSTSLSSGLKVSSYHEISTDAAQYQNILQKNTETQSYIDNIQTVDARLSKVDVALNTVLDLVTATRTRLTSALNATNKDIGLRSFGQEQISAFNRTMNQRDQNQLSIFSGMNTNANAIDIHTPMADANDKSYSSASQSRTLAIAPDESMSYDVLANEDAFSHTLYALKLCANNTPNHDPHSVEHKNLTEALNLLGQATKEITQLMETVNSRRANLKNISEDYKKDQESMKNIKDELTLSDPFEDITKLIQLQAAFSCSQFTAKKILSAQDLLDMFR